MCRKYLAICYFPKTTTIDQLEPFVNTVRPRLVHTLVPKICHTKLTHIIRKDLTKNAFGQITDHYDLP